MPRACLLLRLFSLESLSLQTQVNSLSTLQDGLQNIPYSRFRVAGFLTDGFSLLSGHRASCNGSRSRNPISWGRSFLCCHAQSHGEVYSLEILEGIRKCGQGRRRRGAISLLSLPMMNGIIHSLPIDRRIGKASMINKKELLWHLILLGLGVGYLGIFKS